jgi:CRP-like cAMP-binding protein
MSVDQHVEERLEKTLEQSGAMSSVLGRFAGSGNPRTGQLGTLPLFEGVSRWDRAFMASFLDEVQVEAGRTLVREGMRNVTFWILLEGEVEISIGGQRPRVLRRGDFFGTASMLDGRSAVATVTTRTPIRALVASPAQFRALEGNSAVAARLRSVALGRMREELEMLRRTTAA